MIGKIDCPCGCGLKMADSLISLLTQIEKDIKAILPDFGLQILSGARCPDYNKKVGGSPNSAHLKGIAADIAIPDSRAMFEMVINCLEKGIVRLGNGQNRGFLHVDLGHKPDYPVRVMWKY